MPCSGATRSWMCLPSPGQRQGTDVRRLGQCFWSQGIINPSVPTIVQKNCCQLLSCKSSYLVIKSPISGAYNWNGRGSHGRCSNSKCRFWVSWSPVLSSLVMAAIVPKLTIYFSVHLSVYGRLWIYACSQFVLCLPIFKKILVSCLPLFNLIMQNWVLCSPLFWASEHMTKVQVTMWVVIRRK